ncbi:hypothetical protein A2U01_0083145, partial [Trifolium medium]|nr:hypothetical protein [Trifolium medium]
HNLLRKEKQCASLPSDEVGFHANATNNSRAQKANAGFKPEPTGQGFMRYDQSQISNAKICNL